MTTTLPARRIRDAIVYEPLQLALDQPPQMLISAASVFLVAAEAGILIDWPWNVFLAVGAEWAYLRGLCSGQAARTKWAALLIWAAVILVIAYGSLWGLRKFGLIPAEPPPLAAVLLTALHIGCISAVTLCSAMCHRAELIAHRASEADVEQQKRQRELSEQVYQDEQRRARDAMNLEIERQWKEQQLIQAAERAKLEIRQARRASDATMRPASPPMRRDALQASMDAAEQVCPNCGAHIESRSTWLAARRWGRCAACKG